MLLQFLSLGDRIPECGQYDKSKKFSNDVPNLTSKNQTV